MANELTPDKVYNTGRRVIRTTIQVGLPAFLGFAVVLPSIIEALVQDLPDENQLRLVLLGAAAAVTALAAAITRVMAIPAVNAWLANFRLNALTVGQVGNVRSNQDWSNMCDLLVEQNAQLRERLAGKESGE